MGFEIFSRKGAKRINFYQMSGNNSNNSLCFKKMENIIIIALFASLFFLGYFLFKEIKKQTKFKVKYKLDNSLNKRLLIMLNGDKKAALRLLRIVRKNHPGKSYVWYQEKGIRDLERDRRY